MYPTEEYAYRNRWQDEYDAHTREHAWEHAWYIRETPDDSDIPNDIKQAFEEEGPSWTCTK
jgi:hypothetical protein